MSEMKTILKVWGRMLECERIPSLKEGRFADKKEDNATLASAERGGQTSPAAPNLGSTTFCLIGASPPP